MQYNILVNKNNPISKNFKIPSLVSVGKHFKKETNSYTNKDILLEEQTANALLKMLKDVNTIDKNIQVIPDSGYRNIEYQIKVLNYYIKKEGKEKAMQRVAKPGTSEHHTALAIDVAIFDYGKYIDELTGNEKPIKFMHQNAHKYGFILRYPKGKEDITGVMPEPWHFRYVGEKLANYLHQNNLTLEEYYDLKKEKNS